MAKQLKFNEKKYNDAMKVLAEQLAAMVIEDEPRNATVELMEGMLEDYLATTAYDLKSDAYDIIIKRNIKEGK